MLRGCWAAAREKGRHMLIMLLAHLFVARNFQSKRLQKQKQKEEAEKKKKKGERTHQAAPCSLSQSSQSSGSQGSQPPCVRELKKRAKHDMEQRAIDGECNSDLTSPSSSQSRVGDSAWLL